MDPLARFAEWLAAADTAGIEEPGAMVLATVGASGRPRARVVALRGLDHGFVFYTHLDGPKGRELAATPWAALCWHWRELGRQVRAEGRCRRVSDAESDRYFASRPRDAQLGAWASRQSHSMRNREALLERVAQMARKFDGQPVPRPPRWGGFRVVPSVIELWQAGEHRLHQRELYRRVRGGWRRQLLQP
jgi:pyridoxamine 5'-phosphate oxidase